MSKYNLDDDYTTRVVHACQVLKHDDKEYFTDVVRNLMASEKKRRKPSGMRKRRVDVARNGVRVRGGRAYVTLSPDVEIVGEAQF